LPVCGIAKLGLRPTAMCGKFTERLSFECAAAGHRLYGQCTGGVTKADYRTTIVAGLQSEPIMTTEYTVGLRLETRSEVLTIEAEDALIAALKAKHEHPEAVITYVRKANRRGDRRHPHGGISEKPKK
jgi:hypothetical protein